MADLDIERRRRPKHSCQPDIATWRPTFLTFHVRRCRLGPGRATSYRQCFWPFHSRRNTLWSSFAVATDLRAIARRATVWLMSEMATSLNNAKYCHWESELPSSVSGAVGKEKLTRGSISSVFERVVHRSKQRPQGSQLTLSLKQLERLKIGKGNYFTAEKFISRFMDIFSIGWRQICYPVTQAEMWLDNWLKLSESFLFYVPLCDLYRPTTRGEHLFRMGLLQRPFFVSPSHITSLEVRLRSIHWIYYY